MKMLLLRLRIRCYRHTLLWTTILSWLLSKGMSNIYLKVTIETFPKIRFFGFTVLNRLPEYVVE